MVSINNFQDMSLLRKLASVIGFLAFAMGLSGQSAVIEGYIFSGEGPMELASIAIPILGKGTSSDDRGYFRLTEIQEGVHEIIVSFLGYKSVIRKIKVKENEVLEWNVELTPSHDLLDEIVVTGTMKPTYVSQSPVKVEVITARQLDTYLPPAGSSIVENVQLVNGIQEVISCGVCYTNSISINGLEGAYTAVLMDGSPIYGNLASVYGLNGIPNMIIDRFEVIKGPSSTLYGSEAVAGVINIITKDPADQSAVSIDLMGTTHRESFGNIAFAPKIGASSGFIGLNYAYVNDFDDFNNDQFGDAILLDRYSLFTKWNIHRRSGKKFSLAGKYYYEDRRNGVEEYLLNRNYRQLRGSESVYGESIYTNRAELFGTYEFNTSANIKVDFSLSHHDQDSYYGSDSYQANQKIGFANLLWNINGGKHDLLLGLTTRYNAYDDNSIATEVLRNGQIVNSPNNQFIPGLFIQDEFTIDDGITVLSGIRMDHYPSHGVILAPRLSTKYKPSEWTTLRMNFGTGFRIVNLFTEDHAFVTGQREVVIREELNPERSVNTSINVNHVYSGLGGTGTIDVEAYFTHFSNKIVPQYDQPGKIIYQNSEGYARTRGLGISVNQNFAFPLGINLDFNLQSAREFQESTAGLKEGRNIEFAPRWSGIVSANYHIKSQDLTLAYTARVTGSMALPEVYDLDETGNPLPFSRPLKSDPFSLHNLQINKDFNDQFSLYLGIQNLTNFRQDTSPLIGYNDPSAASGFSQYFDTSYAYAPNHGRELYVGIKWQLQVKRPGR